MSRIQQNIQFALTGMTGRSSLLVQYPQQSLENT